MIVCAGNNENFSIATPMGVGLVESAMNLTQLCLFDKPEHILFMGTAGSYGEYKPFDIVHSQVGANIELGFLDNNAYTPLDNVVSSESEENQFAQTIVNSSNYITTNATLGEKMLRFNIGLENMEFFAIMRVAQAFDIPCGGVFIVTNYTNETAHEDFVKNHTKAKELLENYVKKQITSGKLQP
jgi:nucleoside phosphorylase